MLSAKHKMFISERSSMSTPLIFTAFGLCVAFYASGAKAALWTANQAPVDDACAMKAAPYPLIFFTQSSNGGLFVLVPNYTQADGSSAAISDDSGDSAAINFISVSGGVARYALDENGGKILLDSGTDHITISLADRHITEPTGNIADAFGTMTTCAELLPQ